MRTLLVWVLSVWTRLPRLGRRFAGLTPLTLNPHAAVVGPLRWTRLPRLGLGFAVGGEARDGGGLGGADGGRVGAPRRDHVEAL